VLISQRYRLPMAFELVGAVKRNVLFEERSANGERVNQGRNVREMVDGHHRYRSVM
jgi:hypothetical protein